MVILSGPAHVIRIMLEDASRAEAVTEWTIVLRDDGMFEAGWLS